MTLPTQFATTSEIGLITTLTEHYEYASGSTSTASSTLVGWDIGYYHIPFLIYIVLAVPTYIFGKRIIKEFLKRI